MNLASLSIKRPVFITCIVTMILVVGYLSLRKLPVDLFPNVTFPIVTVTTTYPGAGPEEVETLVSKVYEEELSNVPGLKKLSSQNLEAVSVIIAEFNLDVDIKYAEQQVRDKVAAARKKLPNDIDEPVIRKIDPADQPIITISVESDLPDGELYQYVDKKIKPMIEQVNQVGLVDIYGGRKREIKVELDRNKLKAREISANQVSERLKISGQNIPAGKISGSAKDTVFRTLGEYKTINEIQSTIINFIGNDIPITVNDVGTVKDSLQERKTYAYYNGKGSILLSVYKQSGSNTIGVAKAIKKQVEKINKGFKEQNSKMSIKVVRDGSKPIDANVYDVYETIIIGMILTIIVVFFFLGSLRSTIITGLALPNSLLGAFILLAAAGFTVNIMTLLALSLAVGLLIDDAIVVRENIFRHIEMGADPVKAAIEGTSEVTLAVVATTLTVIAVFAPISFLDGVVGQFFKEFGLTVCFAMVISLFDALTMAPMLSAYFAGKVEHHDPTKPRVRKGIYDNTVQVVLDKFGDFQNWLENIYVSVLKFTLKRPFIVLFVSFLIFIASFAALKYVPKTFLPAQDAGEFMVSIDQKPGTSLDGMNDLAKKVDTLIRSNKEVDFTVMQVGDQNGQPEKASIFVTLVDSKKRPGLNTTAVKARVRELLKVYKDANPAVKDIDSVGGGQRPFNVNIVGDDMKEIEKYSGLLLEKIRHHPALLDVDTSSRPGKPEFQVIPDRNKAERLGVSTTLMGAELRTMVEGTTPAVFRELGEEYNIRVRMKEDQRDLRADYDSIYVPNINNSLIRLNAVAKPFDTTGPANINRQDRGRYIQISADVNPGGPGMGGAITDINRILKDEIKLPSNMKYQFVGQAENFQELMVNMVVAAGLGIMFIYFVLASLYESFVTPFTIMLVLPLAMCGAFYALAITGASLDLFSMIGCIMLLGVATKNSILLVDYANQQVQGGMTLNEAIIASGKARLRPILMTSFALIGGMLPLAIGLNEASKQRTSMGIAVIGGLISSTLLTLVVIPASYSYIERFRVWSGNLMKRIFMTHED
ncbi:MAG: efflux RND transporter permease subunit [Bacteriovorax sp.]|nr:efflux RND transporter permease subunit [Bacteriovorax sp.]